MTPPRSVDRGPAAGTPPTPGTVLAIWHAVAEPGQVAAFARAVRRPGHDSRLPPTFLAVLSAEFTERMVTGILPVDRTRLMHGEQRFEWLAEVHTGARLKATAVLADVAERAGTSGMLRLFTVEITWCEGDTPVCRETSVIIERPAP